jgi:hypothetical protein
MLRNPAAELRNVATQFLGVSACPLPASCQSLTVPIDLIRNLLATIDLNHLQDVPPSTLTKLRDALCQARDRVNDVIDKSYPAGQITNGPAVVPPYANAQDQSNVTSWRNDLETYHAMIYEVIGPILAQQSARLSWAATPAMTVQPGSELERDRHSIIWRYMPLTRLIRCAGASALWMPSIQTLRQSTPDGISDIREGEIPPVVSNLSCDFQAALKKGKAEVNNFLKKHALTGQDLDKLQEFIANPARERNTTFVSSWIKRSSERATMWGTYGDQGRGIAIKSTIGRLIDCNWRVKVELTGIAGRIRVAELVLRSVRYLQFDEKDKIPALDDLHLPLLKRNEFEDEHEIRLVAFTTAPLPSPGFPLHCNLRDVVSEIIVGPKANSRKLPSELNTLLRT